MTENMAGRGEGLAGLAELDSISDLLHEHAVGLRSTNALRGRKIGVLASRLDRAQVMLETALEAAAPAGTPDSYTLIQQAIAIHGHIDLTEKGSRPLDCEVCKRIAAALAAALATPSPQAPATLADHCERCKAGQRREYRTVVMPEPYGGTGWWHWSPDAVWPDGSAKGAWFTCQVQSAPPAATQEQPAGSAPIRRCMARNSETGQCELREGHAGKHLGGYLMWGSSSVPVGEQKQEEGV